MRYIFYIFWGVVALCLIIVSFANRGMVKLHVIPYDMAAAVPGIYWLGATLEVPLFVAILMGVAVGLVIGLLWEWTREHKHRAAAVQNAREAQRLEDEVKRLKAEKHEGKDEVLALLEQTN